MNAHDIMTTKVATVSPDHSVRHAAQIMLDKHISGLPVINDDGRLVGILTEGDLLRRAEIGTELFLKPDRAHESVREYVKTHSWKVGDVMTTNVMTAEERTPIGRVAALMDEHRIKRLPITRDGKLVGIISRADLLRAIAIAKLETPAEGDDAIRRCVLARLGDLPELSEAGLGVIVSGGIVHLWGVVGSKAAGEAARAIAEGVRGVSGVVEHLDVIAERDAPQTADPQTAH